MAAGLRNAQAVHDVFMLAIEEYTRRTGVDFNTMKPPSTEKMRREMAKIATESAASLQIALDFLMKVGEVAIGVASNAWPPAAICFQALQTIMGAKEHYKRYFSVKSVHESLDQILTVLQDVSKYLDGTNVGAQIDDELRDLLCLRLSYFLKMCAAYAEVQTDSRKITGVFKNLYLTFAGHDGGITGILAELKKLEDREKKYLARDTWTITKALWDLQGKDTFQQRKLQTIMAGLGLNEKDPVWKSSLERHIKLRQTSLSNLGTWLLENKSFSNWSKPEAPKHTLMLQAEPSNGKTYLCSQVVETLERRRIKQRNSPSSYESITAYFYLEKSRKSPGSKGKEQRETSIRDVFAAILWQLANLDPVYQNFVYAECTNSQIKPPNGIELWDKFVTAFSKRGKPDGRKIFYIILDGVSSNHSKNIELISILKRAEQLRGKHFQARFFLSGTERALGNISQTLSQITDTIDASGSIKADIHTFIGSRIKEFQKKTNKEEGKILEKLNEKLRQDYSGDYQQAESALDDIKSAIGSMSELEKILTREPGVNVEWHIEKLSLGLSKEDIEEVNDILVCIVLLRVWPSLKQLEAFLKLREGLDQDQERAINVSELQERLQERYFQLFHLDDDENQIVHSYDTMEFFLKQERGLKDRVTRSPYALGLQSGNDRTKENPLHKSEIDTVEKIIKSVCGDEVFERFHFDDFFKKLKDPRNSLSAKIQFNSIEGQMEIIHRLLKATCDQSRDRYKSLHEYAALDLLNHLGCIKPSQMATSARAKKTSIKKNLLAFFKEESVVKAWLNSASIEEIPELESSWFLSIENALLWLNEPAGMPEDLSKHSNTTEKEVVASKDGDQGPEGSIDTQKDPKHTKEELIAVPTEVLARMWLCEDTYDAQAVFRCFAAFCREKYPDIREDSDSFSYLEEDAKHINSFKDRAREILNVRDEDPHLNLRVAETYLSFDEATEAMERCSFADKDSWRTIWCTARAYHLQGKTDQAIKTLEKNEKKLTDQDWRSANESAWSIMVSKLLEWYDEEEETEKAITFSRNLWNAFKTDLEVSKIALQRVAPESSNIESLRSFLTAYKFPVELFHHCASDARFHENVWKALRNDFGGLNKHYIDAIDALKRSEKKPNSTHTVDTLAFLQFHYGMALLHLDRRRQAVIVWEDNISEIRDTFKSDSGEQQSLVQIYAKNIEKLAECYIQMMKKSEVNTSHVCEFAFKIDSSMGGDYASSVQSHRLSFTLARIYSISGRDYFAKESLRGEVRSAFQILTDDIDENDWEGYWRLCQVFVALSDTNNARIAWSLITQETLYETEVCHGDCGKRWNQMGEKDLHVCMDCADVRFGFCCLRNLQEGSLEKHICGKDHEFMSFPKLEITKARKGVEKGIVPGGDKQILDWQKEIRQLFRLEERADETTAPSRLRRFAKRLGVR